jgi:triosephosphate isomerase
MHLGINPSKSVSWDRFIALKIQSCCHINTSLDKLKAMFKQLAPLIIGNWKMHKTIAETREYISHLKPCVAQSSAKIGLAVPYTALAAAVEAAQGSPIRIGAQNMSFLMEGALTGEISATMLVDAGASFVILGHSERRRIFHETDQIINRKMKLALLSDLDLRVILCVGETKEEREAQATETVLKRQLSECLNGIPSEQMARIVVAYEPVWAIGNRHAATQENVEEIHVLCKNFIVNDWNVPKQNVRVLYGGSVTPANARSFLQLPVVDGLLIGGASLDVRSFVEIIYQAETR